MSHSVVMGAWLFIHFMPYSYATFKSRFIICSIMVRFEEVMPSSKSSCASTSVTVLPSMAVECVMMEYR